MSRDRPVAATMQCVRVEDPTHIWVSDGPILLRLCVSQLSKEQMMLLCLAGPFNPVAVEVGSLTWNGNAFVTELIVVCSQKGHLSQKHTSIQRKLWAPMNL